MGAAAGGRDLAPRPSPRMAPDPTTGGTTTGPVTTAEAADGVAEPLATSPPITAMTPTTAAPINNWFLDSRLSKSTGRADGRPCAAATGVDSADARRPFLIAAPAPQAHG